MSTRCALQDVDEDTSEHMDIEDLAALWIARLVRRRRLDSAIHGGSTTASRDGGAEADCDGRDNYASSMSAAAPAAWRTYVALDSANHIERPDSAKLVEGYRVWQESGESRARDVAAAARCRAHCSPSERQSGASSREARRACDRTFARGCHGPEEPRRSSTLHIRAKAPPRRCVWRTYVALDSAIHTGRPDSAKLVEGYRVWQAAGESGARYVAAAVASRADRGTTSSPLLPKRKTEWGFKRRGATSL